MFLEDVKQLNLEGQGHIADFVKKEAAAVCRFQAADSR
jgi:hypothetical protein